MKGLTPQQMKFVVEYMKIGNAAEAAVAAGYSAKSAASRASKLLAMPAVQEYRQQVAREMFAQIGVDESWIGLKLVTLVESCMEGYPHMVRNPETHQMEPDGTWQLNASGAAKAIHELREHMGLTRKRDEENTAAGQSFEDWLAEQNGSSKL